MIDEDDIEEEEFGNLSLFVEVFEDYIEVKLPEIPSFIIEDEQLDHLFFYPDCVKEICGENADFVNSLMPHLLRIRENKRDLYDDMEMAF